MYLHGRLSSVRNRWRLDYTRMKRKLLRLIEFILIRTVSRWQQLIRGPYTWLWLYGPFRLDIRASFVSNSSNLIMHAKAAFDSL